MCKGVGQLVRCSLMLPLTSNSHVLHNRFYHNKVMASEKKEQKNLLVFDFDHSLVDKNTDYYVIKLAPEGKVPEEIQSLYSDDGWTHYMGEIFKYLHDNGTTRQNILDCMSEIELTDGMEQLLKHTMEDNKWDHIIISDSNSVFIEHILKTKNLSSKFVEIFTNPAKFTENGLLTLQGFHHQDWCSLSSENLCKGHILKNFLENQKKVSTNYSHVLYVGDGYNDLCPGLTLNETDFLMPRLNFKLNAVVKSILETDSPVEKSNLKAKVVPWESGVDILQCIIDEL